MYFLFLSHCVLDDFDSHPSAQLQPQRRWVALLYSTLNHNKLPSPTHLFSTHCTSNPIHLLFTLVYFPSSTVRALHFPLSGVEKKGAVGSEGRREQAEQCGRRSASDPQAQ